MDTILGIHPNNTDVTINDNGVHQISLSVSHFVSRNDGDVYNYLHAMREILIPFESGASVEFINGLSGLYSQVTAKYPSFQVIGTTIRSGTTYEDGRFVGIQLAIAICQEGIGYACSPGRDLYDNIYEGTLAASESFMIRVSKTSIHEYDFS